MWLIVGHDWGCNRAYVLPVKVLTVTAWIVAAIAAIMSYAGQ